MTPGEAQPFDFAALSEALRYLVVPIVLVSRELDFTGLTVISDTEWQLDSDESIRRGGGR